MTLYGAVELGGTKTVCAVVTDDVAIVDRLSFPTSTPIETCERAIRFLKDASAPHGAMRAIGIGSFGPIALDAGGPRYGQILNTPKTAWAQTNLLETIARFTELPLALDTDVNCALRAEAERGAGAGCRRLVYVTVGTGVGAGIMLDGHVLRGPGHPEVGHLFVPRFDDDSEFAGSCAYHGGRCVEGLAAGPALERRWGQPADTLSPAHPAWDLEARYLAVLCCNLALTVCPSRIILGGGVMQQTQLFAGLRRHFVELLNDYLDLTTLAGTADDLIVPPGLAGESGVLGAGLLAKQLCG